MSSRSDYEVPIVDDKMIVLIDLDIGGMSVTNDIHAVIDELSYELDGIGDRKVYYRDSMGRYDEILTVNEGFVGFFSCDQELQSELNKMVQDKEMY